MLKEWTCIFSTVQRMTIPPPQSLKPKQIKENVSHAGQTEV